MNWWEKQKRTERIARNAQAAEALGGKGAVVEFADGDLGGVWRIENVALPSVRVRCIAGIDRGAVIGTDATNLRKVAA